MPVAGGETKEISKLTDAANTPPEAPENEKFPQIAEKSCSKTDEKENGFRNRKNVGNIWNLSIVIPIKNGKTRNRKWIFAKSLPLIVRFYKKGIDK